MSKDADVLRVAASLYDAAAGTESWPNALKSLAEVVAAQSALLFTPNPPEGAGLFLGHGLDPTAFDSYGAYYHTKDIWYHRASSRGLDRPAAISIGDAIVPRRDFNASEWCNDFCKPNDIYHLLAGIISDESHAVLPRTHLSFFRPEGGGEFGDTEQKILRCLHPHVERALVIRSRMEGYRGMAEALSDAFQRLATAVVLLQPDGRAIVANKAAEALLKAKDGLALRATGLHATARADDAALQKILSLAAKASGTALGSAGNACTIGRPSGRRSYQIIAFPVSWRTDAALRRVANVVAFIIDPEAAPEIPPKRIARLLHLTAAEARLAAALAAGLSLADYAERAGISLGTARWTLKQVLAKSGTNRQAELVALVLKSAVVRESNG